MPADQKSIDYFIACAAEVFTQEGALEASTMVTRICKASERHVDPTMTVLAQVEQAFENMDMLYRLHVVIGNRRVQAATVARIVRSIA